MPLLQEANGAERWYVARRWEAPDRSFSLQVFVWPPGTRIMIHDHSSLGAYSCAAGTVFEVRYERLDDGSRFEHARLVRGLASFLEPRERGLDGVARRWRYPQGREPI